MRTYELSFKFKGAREYVHGPDIYTAVMNICKSEYGLENISSFKLIMHNFTRNQCRLILDPKGLPEDVERMVADFSVSVHDKSHHGWVVEDNMMIVDRYEFDESQIKALSVIETHKVSIDGNIGYSPVEVAVSLTKQMHYDLFPDVAGKWIVTRFELDRPFVDLDALQLTVVFEHNSQFRLTKSKLLSNGVAFGHIFFSLVKL